ncbi:conserved membrane hypothetical protein [Candidatus Sulfotelmatobacter sp. SbA7]|nr:conserved membrane hypothetical protein [Candidatus Sulfotelmatobacter sp. SbA7]
MKLQPTGRWDRETTLVGQLAAALSLVAFLFYFRHGDLLLYGDAVAHINIARRVIDSMTPGLLQLGTVWLPLPHLVMIPFLLSDAAWQTGIAGSIPSMVAYVLGTVGVFRLVRGALRHAAKPSAAVRVSAWLAALIYAGNPNLLYLQTTAMTEPLYLALFIWALVHFSEFVRADAGTDVHPASWSLTKCGLCVAGACLTRYDGWWLAVVLGVAAVLVALRSDKKHTLGRVLTRFALLAAAGPVLWLGYNAIVYRNPLEFANGPYSARAIEQKSMQSHPGAHDLPAAFSYFLKSAELNMTEAGWQRLWVGVLLVGTLMVFFFDLRLWPLLLLWTPLIFYVLSMAYGGVPIYLPPWWPFSLYNARYGLELVPAFAVFAAMLLHFLLALARGRGMKTAVGVVIAGLVAASYASVWRAQPICYREAWVNSRTRITLETELASNLRLLPHDATLLMYLGDHVGAVQRAGIPLRQTINEGNHRPWAGPSDPEGLWERALADPHGYVDYVIALDGDPVSSDVQKRGLTSMVVIHTVGQPPATIYWTGRSSR